LAEKKNGNIERRRLRSSFIHPISSWRIRNLVGWYRTTTWKSFLSFQSTTIAIHPIRCRK